MVTCHEPEEGEQNGEEANEEPCQRLLAFSKYYLKGDSDDEV